jgi:hypothetical protein
MPNIKFIYLYRDGGNYKKWAEVIFRNPDELSCDFISKRLREAFMQDGLFIAQQIRIPDSFLYTRGEANSDDHCYHEFERVELSADTPDDGRGRSIKQFLAEVQTQSTRGWTAFDPHESVQH